MPYRTDPTRVIIGGSLTLAYGLWSFHKKRQRLKYWVRVKATVENVRREPNGDVFVRVRYVDQGGAARSCSLPYSDGDRVGLGTELFVAFNPVVPDEAFIAEKRDMNLTAITAIVIGCGLIGAGLFALRIHI